MSEISEGTALDALRAEAERLERAYRDARRRVEEAVVASAPFHVGDVVLVSKGGNDEPAIVRSVRSFCDRPEYVVSFRKKDGSWMDRETRVWYTPRPLVDSLESL